IAGHRRGQRLVRIFAAVRLLLILLYLWALLMPAVASAQRGRVGRAQVIFDFPPSQVEKVVSGQSVVMRVPYHTTGDLVRARYTLWSRGVTVSPVSPPDLGDVGAFTASAVTFRVTAPSRIPYGLYSMTLQIDDANRARN